MRKTYLIGLVSLLLFGCIAAAGTIARATTLLYKNLDDLVSEADAVVAGTVQKTATHRGPENSPYTFVKLTKVEVLHGEYNRGDLTLRLKGGVIDGEGLEIHGSPSFSPSDRVIVFLRNNGRDMVPIVGWSQGVFRVSYDSDVREDIVTDHEGNRVFGVQDSDLVKEHRRPEETNIVDGAGSSTGPSFFPGVMEDGRVPALKGEPGAQPRGPMAVEEFVRIVKQRAEQKARPRVTVKSVEELDFSGVRMKGRDAAPVEGLHVPPAVISPEPELPKGGEAAGAPGRDER